MVELKEISQAVIEGDETKARELTEKRLADGGDPIEILNDALIGGGMGVVGERFKKLEIYVPEVLMSAAAMSTCVEVLRPLLKDKDVKHLGTIVIGTVKGDVHDIGKNLVSMMMEGAGFEVVDLGTNVTSDKFVEAIEKHNAEIVGMSALLSTTMLEFKNHIETFKEAGVRDRIKVMVGGASVTERFAMESGADFYGENAMAAVDKAKEYASKV